MISSDLRLERYPAYATRSKRRCALQLLPSFAGWGPSGRLGSSIQMAQPPRFQGLVRIEAFGPLCRGDYRTLATTPTGHPSRGTRNDLRRLNHQLVQAHDREAAASLWTSGATLASRLTETGVIASRQHEHWRAMTGNTYGPPSSPWWSPSDPARQSALDRPSR